MLDNLIPNPDDEIDFREIFIILWAYKLLIVSTCIIGIIFGGYYALNKDKQFTSEAIFKLGQAESGNVSIGGELASLVGVSAFGGTGRGSILPTDQATGRIFIEKLDAKLNFKADPYFNTYSPKSTDPIWKSLIKRTIGWQKSEIDDQEAIWQGIASSYSNNVTLEETSNGSIKVKVTHMNAQRAAKIANAIMEEIITSTRNKQSTEQDQQLIYLSNTLAKALSDLELSQSNLKDFALKNSALPMESFAAGSLELDALREQLSRTTKLHEAVAALATVLKNKTINNGNYLELRKQFPIVDQVEFRRVLGQNEIISSWTWPNASSVDTVFNTLSDRKKRLQSQINESQVNAERSSMALETYAKLEREAKIAEATYTVLIEQVKAQSMAAGFRPDKTEIYEYASASVVASAPNRKMILIICAVIGLFLGIVVSLALGMSRGVYYTRNSLKIGAQAKLSANNRSLLHLKNKSLNDINKILAKKPNAVLRNMAVEINKRAPEQIVITSLRARLSCNDVALALASYMQSNIRKISVIDFSSNSKKLDVDDKKLSIGSFVVVERIGHVSILRPNIDLAAIEMLSQKNFWENIQLLNSTFDLVFLCADNDDAISLLSALQGQKMFHITLARTKKTKSASLTHMRSILPIQGLFHD